MEDGVKACSGEVTPGSAASTPQSGRRTWRAVTQQSCMQSTRPDCGVRISIKILTTFGTLRIEAWLPPH